MGELTTWQALPIAGAVRPEEAPRTHTGSWRTGEQPVIARIALEEDGLRRIGRQGKAFHLPGRVVQRACRAAAQPRVATRCPPLFSRTRNRKMGRLTALGTQPDTGAARPS